MLKKDSTKNPYEKSRSQEWKGQSWQEEVLSSHSARIPRKLVGIPKQGNIEDNKDLKTEKCEV